MLGKYHGTAGSMEVTTMSFNLTQRIVTDAFREMGYSSPNDHNGENQIGNIYEFFVHRMCICIESLTRFCSIVDKASRFVVIVL